MISHQVHVLTDSSSQLGSESASANDISVIPVTIELDGQTFLEGFDLHVDDFYRLLASDSVLSTSQPPPARFVQAVEVAAKAGATAVVAVLVGSAYSGSVQSARLASTMTSIPLHVLDTEMASFGVAYCALEAVRLAKAGSTIEDLLVGCMDRSRQLESVFVLQGLELAERSGRFEGLLPQHSAGHPQEANSQEEGILVLWAGQGQLEVVETVHSAEDAVQAMSARIFQEGRPVHVALSLAAPAMKPMTDMLERVLHGNPLVCSLAHYRVGPSVAAQTGPGTGGVFYYPAK